MTPVTRPCCAFSQVSMVSASLISLHPDQATASSQLSSLTAAVDCFHSTAVVRLSISFENNDDPTAVCNINNNLIF